MKTSLFFSDLLFVALVMCIHTILGFQGRYNLRGQVEFPCKICETLKKNEQKLTILENKVDSLIEATNCTKKVRNCQDLYKCGQRSNGVYRINPDGQGDFDVFCDQNTDGGGWTVFQRRLDGSVDFYRGWTDYKNGFGNKAGEYWLGLDKINRLTNSPRYKLRVDLMDTQGNKVYAVYSYFAVSSESLKYRLSLGTYSGNAGDSLGYHGNRPFSTKDRDNDAYPKNCANEFHGAWWYGSCHNSNLNGRYLLGAYTGFHAQGVVWETWKGMKYSVKLAEMKIKPLD